MNWQKCETGASMLRQREFMLAFWALDESTLNQRWTTRAGKRSPISYVKPETAFWATQYTLRLRTHFKSLSSTNKTSNGILKTFLEMLPVIDAKVFNDLETIIKYTVLRYASDASTNQCWSGKNAKSR